MEGPGEKEKLRHAEVRTRVPGKTAISCWPLCELWPLTPPPTTPLQAEWGQGEGAEAGGGGVISVFVVCLGRCRLELGTDVRRPKKDVHERRGEGHGWDV